MVTAVLTISIAIYTGEFPRSTSKPSNGEHAAQKAQWQAEVQRFEGAA